MESNHIKMFEKSYFRCRKIKPSFAEGMLFGKKI